MNDTVLLARDGAVATLTLNRPDALNALDPAMVDALVARTAEVAADDTLRVVVIRGAASISWPAATSGLRLASRRSARGASRGFGGWSSACTRRSRPCTGCRTR
jgi:enoyl-CoA hydratase/carnithine racemase